MIVYSVEKPEHYRLVLETIVPDYVKNPPADGWKDFPPDIDWAGAEMDSTNKDYQRMLKNDWNPKNPKSQ